jgi:hypothetical protein
MVRRLVRFAAVAAAVALPAVVQAQLSCNANGGAASNCSVDAVATLTIPSLATVTIPTEAITLDGSGITSFTTLQYLPGAFGDVVVSANRAYTLTIGSAPTFTTAGAGVRGRETLEYSVDGGTNFVAMTAGAALLGGGATASTSTPLQFRAVVPAGASNPANAPGSYTLDVVFLLTTP